ncbi:hypothetical protein SEA_SPEEDDEMON_1550 [Gordonia phage SpeedDemon]|nr:hypothetical protein SEA_SPEEDDEMON_1550 [Gordonia phage SpeedDemon]
MTMPKTFKDEEIAQGGAPTMQALNYVTIIASDASDLELVCDICEDRLGYVEDGDSLSLHARAVVGHLITRHSVDYKPFECQDCLARFASVDDLELIDNVFQRVEPGDPMPHGQCPDCGALVHKEK